MRVAYFDCQAGASGDMVLGALVDAGWPLAELEAALRALGVPGWRVSAAPVERGGLRGTHLRVETDPARRFPHLSAMLETLERGHLAPPVRDQAGAVLRRLAEAEGRVHGVPVEAVHFHEVGALDTLVDVVGAVAGLAALGIERLAVSPLPLGGGTVETAHGRLPVPAPATVELCRGFPVFDNGVRSEVLTPTGAALLTTLARPGPIPAMTLEATGWGAGTRELPVPNLLRILIGQASPAPGPVGAAGPARETLASLETTIDDLQPQLYEPLIDRLLQAGALDVHLAPVIMKRSRPGTVVSVLAPPDRVEVLGRVLFEETTTIGVRWHEVRRRRLPRETVQVTTPYGEVAVKVSRLDGRPVTVTPEFEEVRRLAGARGLPVRVVLDAARAAARSLQAGDRGSPPTHPS
jgi:uncharacterized protein (TIGR00299 family) protein